MNNSTARIAYDGGQLHVPATDAYDRQLLLEHVACSTGLYGEVQLAMDGVVARVQPRTEGAPRRCTRCARPIPRLVFVLGSHALCGGCFIVVANMGRVRSSSGARGHTCVRSCVHGVGALSRARGRRANAGERSVTLQAQPR